MKNPWLHRLALLLVLLVFLLIAAGASLTSLIRPLPGAPAGAPVSGPTEAAAWLEQVHKVLAGLVALAALAFLTSAGKERREVRLSSWIAVALVVIDSWLGFRSGSLAGVMHALLAPLLFSTAAAIAVFTSRSWEAPAAPAEEPWPRRLAVWVPIFLVMQIGLGAAFRHNTMGVISHIMNAMIVLLLILVLGISVLRLYPGHPALRPAALWLLVITGVQVLLGFGVYITLLIVSENNLALMTAGTIHVLTGSLTLAASVVLTIQLQRSAPAAAPQKTRL
jgi:heme A synthase